MWMQNHHLVQYSPSDLLPLTCLLLHCTLFEFLAMVDNTWLSSTLLLHLIFNLFFKPFSKCYALSMLCLNPHPHPPIYWPLSFILLITSPHGLPAFCPCLIFLPLSYCLPLCFLSGCLIKGALSNEITPWGLMVWLIDRHTAGED